MASPNVVHRSSEGTVRRYAVMERGITVGRGDQNDIMLESKRVSRQHARFWFENGRVHVEDLNSRNGIVVNGEPVSQLALAEGDRVTIGEGVFEIEFPVDSGFGRTVFSREEVAALQDSIARDPGDDRLLVLYQAAQLLGERFDLDELLNKILELIASALPVERGFVLIRNQGREEPEIRAAKGRMDDGGAAPLSQTMIHHVYEHEAAILTLDAQADSRFGNADSIMDHDIHAAMCAPLHGRESVAGVIYVDVGSSTHPLTENDLKLLSAVARVVGVAVENARLYRENVEQERLAAIGMATAGLGHCIKNILTGIRGGAQFVNMAIEKDDLKYLSRGWPILSRAMERIDMLVMNMLTISKDRAPERTRTEVNSMIRDVLGLFEARAEKRKVGLSFEPSEVPFAHVDGRAIYRVLVNLLVNAVEACEHNKGDIKVSCECTELACTITIRDTGIGIPEEILPQLSQVFVSSKGSSGTGLGLACSFKIVREHGGDITITSEKGKGTDVTVYIPEPTASADGNSGIEKKDD